MLIVNTVINLFMLPIASTVALNNTMVNITWIGQGVEGSGCNQI